jgi:hypothetical protein
MFVILRFTEEMGSLQAEVKLHTTLQHLMSVIAASGKCGDFKHLAILTTFTVLVSQKHFMKKKYGQFIWYGESENSCTTGKLRMQC